VASAVAFAALSLALASALEPPLTAQETLLSEQITGNFACKVDAVDVNLDLAGAEEKTTITTDDLKTALARTATLEWAHVNQFFFSSTDGRDSEKSLYTGGGDMGEFVQSLIAYTKVTGATLVQADVSDLFSRYLKIMSKEKFFYETDEKAYFKLAVYTGCPNLKIAEVGERAKKKAIVDAMLSAEAFEFIGDPYLKVLTITPFYDTNPQTLLHPACTPALLGRDPRRWRARAPPLHSTRTPTSTPHLHLPRSG
jgi:hypothetical protein